LACDQGNYAKGRIFLEESLLLSRELNDKHLIGYALNHLGRIAFEQDDPLTARSYYEEGLPLLRETGNKPGVAWLLNNLGAIASSQGDHLRARPYFEESLKLHREVGNKQGMALALDNLGLGALSRNDFVAAQQFHQESLALFYELGDKQGIVYGLEGLASLAHIQEKAEDAARLLGTASALRESIGFVVPPREQENYTKKINTTREKLGAHVFALAWAEGRAMTLTQMADLALCLKRNE